MREESELCSIPNGEAAFVQILIVDSNKTDLVVNRDLCEAYGHQADAVRSVEEALARVVKNSYDIALVELNLPENGGLMLVKEIARIKPTLPIYILTDGISVAKAVKAIKMKAADIMYKPLDIQKLNHLQTALTPAAEKDRGV
jgi:DNA-binding NtrC family response regulator